MSERRWQHWRPEMVTVGRDAVLIVVASAVLALATNAVRSTGLPLVASEPYTIVVPCPEPGGEVESIAPAAARAEPERTLRVDARSTSAYEAGHLDGAISVPYDFLDATPAATVQRIAASRVTRIVVYGDGGDPDSGAELARELAGAGIRNVTFVLGGAPALLEAEPAP